MTITVSTDLARQIQEEFGENVYLCYQCKKCTAGCPVAEHFDLTPNQVIRALQFGQKDLVLNSKAIWLCASCETCSTRCPQGIDIARLMDALRVMARREGVKPKVPEVPMFYNSALRGIKLFGRMHELSLMAELYMREFFARRLDFKQFFSSDIPLAIKMLRTGKLKIPPSVARARRDKAQKLQTAREEAIAYYPGCSLHATAVEYDISTKAVAKVLGLELVEPEGWKCCGTSPAHATDPVLAAKLPMENLALFEKEGFSYVTMPCAGCFTRFRHALHDMRENPKLREEVEEALGYLPSQKIQVDNLLVTITDRVGYEKVASKVKRPLRGLKVVCYYGCVLTRPPEITGVKDYEYPMNMDRLMEALGAESLDWSYKTDCCGGSLSLSQLPVALEMSEKILRNAKEVGAEMIVVACPLCQANLDMRQGQINERFGTDYHMPIIYFTQVMGLAFGLSGRELAMEKLFTSPMDLLKSKGFLAS
ncbi:MAG: heterodisulfide reductase-related iron-sulfur binding cluster [Anaerolineae bacterium]